MRVCVCINHHRCKMLLWQYGCLCVCVCVCQYEQGSKGVLQGQSTLMKSGVCVCACVASVCAHTSECLACRRGDLKGSKEERELIRVPCLTYTIVHKHWYSASSVHEHTNTRRHARCVDIHLHTSGALQCQGGLSTAAGETTTRAY